MRLGDDKDMKRIIRVFPSRTNATPQDENARVNVGPGWFDEADAHRVSTRARFRNPQPVPTTSVGSTTPPFSHPFQESRFTAAFHQPEPMESFRVYCIKKSSFKTDCRS
jgi:hypothetical protein